MASYTRQSTFSDGDLITAALFNDEYNQLLAAFDNATGHKHDGTVGEGPVISVLGDAGLAAPLNKILIDTTNDHIEFWIDVSGTSTQQLYIADGAIVPVTDNDIDLGTNSLQFKDLYINGTANIDNLAADSVDINGGNIDGTVIGATTAAAGTFTTIDASGNVVISGNLTVSGTTTSVNSNEVNIGDNIIVLNSDETGTPSQNAGIEIERGTSTNVSLLWNESNDYWTFGSNDLNFPDSSKAKFGTGNDLQIYHDGTHSVIDDVGTGNLILQTNGTQITLQSSSEYFVTAQNNGAVTLYHNGSAKLATTSTGIDVTGTTTTDGLTVNSGGTSSFLSIRNDSNSSFTKLYSDLNGVTILDVDANNVGAAPRFQIDVSEVQALRITEGNDIYFYEDTGSTAKFFWDASAESLGIGTTSPAAAIHAQSSTAEANRSLRLAYDGTYYFDLRQKGAGGIVYNAVNASSGGHRWQLDGNEKARIDYSGNLLIGTTNDFPPGDTGNEGVAIKPDNIAISRNNSTALFLDRMTGDGNIIDFRKDNTNVGSIEAATNTNTDISIGSNNVRLLFFTNGSAIVPRASSNASADNTIDLGNTGNRFKDLHLAGTANFGSLSDGTITITGFVDEDNMASNSATLLPTQQSVKAYVDSQISSAGGNGISFEDNEKAQFGDGNDLQIYHDGSNSYIKEAGIGNLQIQATGSTFIKSSDGTKISAQFAPDSYTRLYHNNANKLETTSTGIDVTGNVVSDGIDLEENTSMYTQDATLSYYGSTNGVYLNGAGNDGWLRLNASGASNDANAINIFGANVGIGITFKTASSERARIDASGRLLIGQTSSNGDKLEIQGDANVYAARLNGSTTGGQSYGLRVRAGSNSSDAGLLVENTSGTDLFKVRGDGNVGIGTSSPSYALTVVDSGNVASFGDGTRAFRVYTDADEVSLLADGSVPMKFYTSGAERARIDSSGNVGIGTTSPDAPLTVHNSSDPEIRFGYSSTQDHKISWDSSKVFIEADPENANGSSAVGFRVDGSEKARIDSSGNLLVGTTNDFPPSDSGNEGVAIKPDNIAISRNASTALFLDRMTSDGIIVDFRKDNSNKGNIGSVDSANGLQLYIASGNSSSSGVGLRFVNVTTSNYIAPVRGDGSYLDDTVDLGISSARFDDIYATNGTIQTSDRNEKQDIQELSDAEQRVATACKGLIRRYKFNSAVTQKGDDARYHFGIIAQDLQDAFTAEGLDAGDYGMFISDTYTDDNGIEQTRLGVRYNELLAFIIATL